MNHSSLRVAIVGMTTVATLLSGSVVSAHEVHSGWMNTWGDGNGKCVNTRASANHGNGGGEAKGSVEFEKEFKFPWGAQIDCTVLEGQPAGEYAVRVRAFRWNGATGKWELCAPTDTGWGFNNVPADRLHATWRNIIVNRGPCGDGWYYAHAGGFAWHNGAWKGGWVATWQAGGDQWHWWPT